MARSPARFIDEGKTVNVSKPSLALLAAAVVLTSCGGAGAGDGPAPSFPPPTTRTLDPGSIVVLQVQHLGGMVASWDLLTRLQEPSVYSDGRVIRQIEQFTTPLEQLPALPEVVQQDLTPAGLDALVQRARDAGVGDGADLGDPLVTDVTTTRFVLTTEKGPVWSDAYALRFSAGLDGVIGEPVPSPSISVGSGRGDGTFTQEQADARYKLLDLAAALDNLPAALGAEQVGEQVPYQFDALAVVMAPGSADDDLEALPWPGPALPGQDAKINGSSCTVVRGADLAPVLEAASQARLQTPWTDGGRTWDLRFRPLLPDESTCEDLAPLPES